MCLPTLVLRAYIQNVVHQKKRGKEVPTTFSSNKVTQLECHVKYPWPLNSNQIIISDAAFNPPLSFVNISNSAITVCARQ